MTWAIVGFFFPPIEVFLFGCITVKFKKAIFSMLLSVECEMKIELILPETHSLSVSPAKF